MGILDTLVNTVAKKIIIDTAVGAAVKTVGAVADYNSKKDCMNSSVIKLPNPSDYYYGRDFHDVQNELTAYGFINIALLPQRDLIKGWLTKNGAVERVSINGNTEFRRKAKFPNDARVVITYHTFKNMG